MITEGDFEVRIDLNGEGSENNQGKIGGCCGLLVFTSGEILNGNRLTIIENVGTDGLDFASGRLNDVVGVSNVDLSGYFGDIDAHGTGNSAYGGVDVRDFLGLVD